MFNANDIEAWAQEYKDAPDVQVLVNLIEADRNLPQPSTLRPGSPERMLAEQRQSRLLSTAEKLGYRPPVKEVAHTIVAETVKSSLIVATLGESELSRALDKLPAPERAEKAEREEEKARKRKRGIGLGFDLKPE